MIKLRFTTLDGIRKTKQFKTLAGARKAAHNWVGKDAELGSYYAISADGVVKVTAEGCTLAQLFGDEPKADPYPDGNDYYKVRIGGDYIAKTFQYPEDAADYIYGLGELTYDKPDGSIGVLTSSIEHWRTENGKEILVPPTPTKPTFSDGEIPF